MTHFSVPCELCGADTLDATALVINRIGIGSPGARSWLQYGSKVRGEYFWDQESGRYSGRALCWPHCACTYLEALVTEHEYEVKRGRR